MKECIVLAGGLGTRLQSVVKDVPKCMAEVAGQPFLHYILNYLQREQIDHVILSLGYKSEVVVDWLKQVQWSFKISIIIEEKALGTGGAIQYAFSKVEGNCAFVMNGDTFFDITFDKMLTEHTQSRADVSVALKPMQNFDRYGAVEVDGDTRILQFKEKVFIESGLINGGTYCINKSLFSKEDLPEVFSFEKEILEKQISCLKIQGCIFDNYFIDIGIPADFAKANIDFKN